MDPLKEICADIHGLIFQHFTVDEVLECSTVSKKWYRSIGKSSEALGKVWINVGDRFNEPLKEDLKAFRASERKYQNFKISEIENGLQILLIPKRSWKRAQIDIQSFTSYRDYTNLLKIFNETIVELEIFDMDIEIVNQDEMSVISFENLAKLRIGFVPSIALHPFISNMPKLKILILEDISEAGRAAGESGAFMTSIVQAQSQLTRLSLSADSFSKIFKENLKFRFQLSHLLVEYSGTNDSVEASKSLLENFERFVATQKQLNWVTICEWTSVVIMKQIFAHPTVERISIDYFDLSSKKMDTESLNLISNSNIKQLDFNFDNITLAWVKPFLEAAPNVTTLYFFHLPQDLLEYLLRNLKQLKTLKYCSIFEFFIFFRLADEISQRVEIVEEKFVDFNECIQSC